jgi:hypothetical protein
MGKGTLLIVLATALGGSLLLASTRMADVGATRALAGVEADVLARELAASGQRLLLGAALSETGFSSTAPFARQEFDGGVVVVDNYSAAGDSLVFELTAFHSGAAHRIRSSYTWTNGDFPGPLLLSAPYVTTDIATAATISGGALARPSYLDRRRFFEMRLESLLDFDEMTERMAGHLGATNGPGGDLSVVPSLDDVSAAHASPSLEVLYYDALDALDDADLVYSDLTLDGELLIGTAESPRIVHVNGRLEMLPGARLEGNGLILVEGPLEMDAGATLDWDGLILVRTESDFLPVRLDGEVDLRGALLVDQQGVPPGGHMDLTIMRDHSGVWALAKGVETQTDPVRPWHRHTHKYDLATGGRTVYFFENGLPGRYDLGVYHRTRFYSTLAHMGNEEVVLEVANNDMHGLGRLHMRLAGDELSSTAVRYGFPTPYASDNPLRTSPFPASDLRDLILEIRSLRLLSYKPNNSNCGPHLTLVECGDRPQGVGGHYDRDGALTLRLRRASDDALMYEAAAYWHWKEEEADGDAAEESAWRLLIQGGQSFGTRVGMGPDVSLVFDRTAIRPIGQRLGFLRAELRHTGTWTTHWSPGEADAPQP